MTSVAAPPNVANKALQVRLGRDSAAGTTTNPPPFRTRNASILPSKPAVVSRAASSTNNRTNSSNNNNSNGRSTSTGPTSPTIRPAPSNKRFSTVQSKVGSLEAIHYKPKTSEKKIPTFKQDFSHIKSRVDHTAPVSMTMEGGATSPRSRSAATSPVTSPINSPPTRPVRTTASTSSTSSRPASRTPSTTRLAMGSIAVRTGGPQSSVSAISLGSPMNSPPGSRRSSASSTLTSPPLSPTSPRRMSKHVLPTQKLDYSNIRSKVGSLDNISYKTSTMTTSDSRDSSADEDTRSTTTTTTTSSSTGINIGGARRSSSGGTFKIPKPKKVDYSNVRSKVGSLDYVSHVPQGGNIRVFSEKLSFREQAQSKIAKEIGITEFYQDEKSFDTMVREQEEAEAEGGNHHNNNNNNNDSSGANSENGHILDQDISEIYSDLDDIHDFHQPPKSLLAVLEEVTENVGTLELEQDNNNNNNNNNQYFQGEHYRPSAAAAH
ncbi:hypothetical protein BG004_000167 [Podila humilis]|nr:hypothetical protein BG004_000167 [Podila humilis]